MLNEKDLFGNENSLNNWQDEWKDMPEYTNIVEGKPLITATFKFKSEEDFKTFNKLIKEYLYGGEKVFDGMQRKDVKSAWYPPKEKTNKYLYIQE